VRKVCPRYLCTLPGVEKILSKLNFSATASAMPAPKPSAMACSPDRPRSSPSSRVLPAVWEPDRYWLITVAAAHMKRARISPRPFQFRL